MSTEGNKPVVAPTSSEQELRLLVDAIPALVWKAGPDGRFEYVNKRVLEYTGAPLSEIIDWGWMDKVHPDDVALKVGTWLESLESGNPHDAVCRIRGADGQYRWFEICGEPLRASDGTVLSWCGVLIDIDDRRKAEDAHRESEYKLRQIIEAVPALLWSTGTDGEPTHVNQRLLDYSGMRFEEFKRVGWEAFVHPDDFPETARAFYHAIHTGTSYQGVMRLRRADGEFRWHHARCEPLHDRQGRIIHWYGVTLDVDEGKKAEEWPGFVTQLQTTLNVIPAYTWYTAPSGGLTFVNKRTADYLGLPKDHPLRFGIDIGAPWDAYIPLLHPDDREASREVWSTCLRSGEAYEFSQRVRNAQGGYRWFLSRAEPLRTGDGTLLQWVGVNLDIGELKGAEQALQRSQFYLSEGQRLAHMGSWALNPSGSFDHWSHELFQIYGLDPQKGAPTVEQYLATVHPLDRDFMAETIRRMHAQRCGCDVKKRIVRPDGELRYVRCVGIPVIEDEVLKVFLGSAMDITEQELLTQELERRQAYLAQAQRLSRTGTWAANTTTTLYWSEESYRIWGLDPQQGLPNHEVWRQRIHPDDRDRLYQEALQAVRQRRDYTVEYRIVLPDGTVKYLEATGHPVFSVLGELVEVVGSHIDVTERKRAQEEHERLRQLESDLAHMNRLSMMGELAASLAHEITQPIATARNNARAALNFLDKQPPDLGEVRDALDCVVGDADRAGIIIGRIRDHIKKAPPRKHRFDLNEAISEVIVLAHSAIAENGVFVQTRLSEGLAPVEGDRVQLQQVILNLVLNAAESMAAVDKGARDLLISSEESRTNGVLVRVRDSGPGIDPEYIERVFDAFYTTKPSGMGMGLSICRSIIDGHGGRLWAGANEPRGAAFQFTLPGSETSS
jgi:PAS domain S-box-containing protein